LDPLGDGAAEGAERFVWLKAALRGEFSGSEEGRAMRFLIMALALWAGAVQAQWVAPDVDPLSAAGPISIVDSDDGWSRVLQVGKQRFFEDGIFRYVSVEDQRGALYLIFVSAGGTGCGGQYAWLHTDGGTARLTDLFGTCSEKVEVASDAETVTVTMPAFAASDGFVAFVYDGKTIEEGIVGQRSAGVGLVGVDWVGRYPFEVLRDTDWRPTLEEMMGPEAYARAGEVIATSSPFEVQGSWVVGEGFAPRMRGNAHGLIALHIEDEARAIVAIRTEERGVEIWGELEGSVPEAVMDFVNGG